MIWRARFYRNLKFIPTSTSVAASKVYDISPRSATTEFTLIFTLRAICPDQKLFAGSSSSRRTGVINRDAVFWVVVRYLLLAAEISRLDARKIILVAVWRHAKILVSADFIVFGREQSQKIKPAASQNAGRRRSLAGARVHDLVLPASSGRSARIKLSRPPPANTQSCRLISASSSRSSP